MGTGGQTYMSEWQGSVPPIVLTLWPTDPNLNDSK